MGIVLLEMVKKMSEKELSSQEQRWFSWYNLENRSRARCVLIKDAGKWTHLSMVYDHENKKVVLSKNGNVHETLKLADEDVLWCAAYCNMELQFLVL